MEIGVIGINHKLADVALRELIAKAFQSHHFHCFSVLLSTCNRSELYFSSENLAITHQEILQALKCDLAFEQKLYTFFGIDCFSHLAKVTAGLDSAIIGETEIQGQVKQAYEAACSKKTLCKALHFLFQKSLKTAKEVRASYPKSLPDIEHVLLHYAEEYFGAHLPSPLFVGASDINLKIARFFKKKGVTNIGICNRTAKNFDDLSFLPWEKLHTQWHSYDWIICATKCPHFILHETHTNLKSPKLLIDLSVPRNIHPNVQNETTKLLNIDDLQSLLDTRMQALEQKVHDAERYIFSKVYGHVNSFNAKEFLCV